MPVCSASLFYLPEILDPPIGKQHLGNGYYTDALAGLIVLFSPVFVIIYT